MCKIGYIRVSTEHQETARQQEIKYLQTFGFNVINQVFAENSWYFRNALVRANFNDLQNNIHSTTVFLEQFMENLLTGAQHDLKNRYMHVDYSDAAKVPLKVPKRMFQSAKIALWKNWQFYKQSLRILLSLKGN